MSGTITFVLGESKYTVPAIKRKDAMRLFYRGVSVLESVGSGRIDFDELLDVADKFLSPVVVETPSGIVEISDLEDNDFFSKKPDEFVKVFAEAFKANYPDIEFDGKEKKKGSGSGTTRHKKR